MRVTQLVLRDFRNYREQAIRLGPGLNAFIGANAQGKTNLLEALHLLATGRSHRGARDADLVRSGADSFYVEARVERRGTTVQLDFSVGAAPGRRVRLDGIPQRRMSDLVGQLAVVFFGPDDLQLLKGPPAGRRRLLDILLAQVSPAYLHELQRYTRALAQRNRLLRQVGAGEAAPALLDAWDEPLLDAAAELTVRRVRALDALGPAAAGQHRRIAGAAEELDIAYSPAVPGLTELAREGPSAVRERLRGELQRRRREEIARSATLVGPHRDDIAIRIAGRDARAFASQGQQRTAVLALKLAELAYMTDLLGEPPVLLLDDVVSELDPHRRRHLLGAVQHHVQTLLTATDAQDLAVRRWPADYRLFRVEAGTVAPLRFELPTAPPGANGEE